MEAKISVIIPIYNVEEYIEECLTSVLQQSLKEIEIICVNDGTKDNSMGIVEKYAAIDNRIVVVNKENGGLSSARNAGLRVANGKYVFFLDSDDYIHEYTLEYLFWHLEKDSLDTIFFDADSFFETPELEQELNAYKEYYHRSNIYEEPMNGQDLFRIMLANKELRPSACLQINRTEFLRTHNIEFYEGIIHEDDLFTVRCSLYSKAAKHVNKTLYKRRVREGSIMTTKGAAQSAYGYFISIYKLIDEVSENAANDEALSSYILQLRKMKNKAVNALKDIPDDEYSSIDVSGTPREKIMYDLLISGYTDLVRSNSKRNNKLNSRISKLEKKVLNLNKKVAKLEKKEPGFIERLIKKLRKFVA